MSWEETINNRRDMALSIIRRGSTFGYCDGCPFLSPYPSAAKCELLDWGAPRFTGTDDFKTQALQPHFQQGGLG